jgi:hypothetical protein
MNTIKINEEKIFSTGEFVAYEARYLDIVYKCLITRAALHKLAGKNLKPFLTVFDHHRQTIAQATKQRLVDDPGIPPVLTESDFKAST